MYHFTPCLIHIIGGYRMGEREVVKVECRLLCCTLLVPSVLYIASHLTEYFLTTFK